MKRIGVIGYNVNTGIGSLVQDYKRNLPIDTHYVIKQPNIGFDKEKLDDKCVMENKVMIDDWLDTIDRLITIESPFIDGVFEKCKKRNIKIICSVDIDWFSPELDWWKYVDVFICPNRYTFNQLDNYGYKNKVYIPASIDTEYFEFKKRNKSETFLFNNGWGGVNERKGLPQVVQLMYELNFPVVINTQREISVSSPKMKISITNYKERTELYKFGDIYLAPSKWEGHGIHILEAMACGLPVITTDFSPMNEYIDKKEYLIRVKRTEYVKNWRLNTVSSTIDIDDFKQKIKNLYGKQITKDSEYVRERIEKFYSFKVNRDKFLKVIEHA